MINRTCATCDYNDKRDEKRCNKCTEDLHQYKKWKIKKSLDTL